MGAISLGAVCQHRQPILSSALPSVKTKRAVVREARAPLRKRTRETHKPTTTPRPVTALAVLYTRLCLFSLRRPLFSSLVSLLQPAIDRKESCKSTIDQQEALTRPSLHKASQASKDITSQLSASIFLPVVPPQRSTSAPPVSNQEPLRLELKQQKEHERVGALLRGVSQDFSQTLAEPMSSVPSAQCPVPTTSTARARTGEQAGQAPFLSTAGVDSSQLRCHHSSCHCPSSHFCFSWWNCGCCRWCFAGE